MESEDISWEEKCENLMNIVVESRKRFGKMCVDYDQKCNIMENKMLNLQIETMGNYHFKSKNVTPSINMDDLNKDIEEFSCEVVDIQRKRENLKKQLKNMENVVLQLKRDCLGKRVREPLTAEALLSRAKSNLVQNVE